MGSTGRDAGTMTTDAQDDEDNTNSSSPVSRCFLPFNFPNPFLDEERDDEDQVSSSSSLELSSTLLGSCLGRGGGGWGAAAAGVLAGLVWGMELRGVPRGTVEAPKSDGGGRRGGADE